MNETTHGPRGPPPQIQHPHVQKTPTPGSGAVSVHSRIDLSQISFRCASTADFGPFKTHTHPFNAHRTDLRGFSSN
jgi:hypothetical protein